MRRSPKSKMAPSLILAKEREQNGLALRKAGFTYAEIGKKLGITEMGAYEAVKRALAHLSEKIVEDAEMFRRLELERLDALQNVFWKPALKGNLRATETILSIMRRRADLMGLDRKYTAEPRESSERATEVKVVFQDGRGVEYPFEKIFPKNQAEPAK